MSSISNLGRSVLVFHIIFFIVSIFFISSDQISSTVGEGGFQFNVGVSIVTMVASLIAVGIVIALIGIQGLASGLNDTSTFTIQRLVVFGAIWGILSAITYQIFSLLSYFGLLIYIIMSAIFGIYIFVGGSD